MFKMETALGVVHTVGLSAIAAMNLNLCAGTVLFTCLTVILWCSDL